MRFLLVELFWDLGDVVRFRVGDEIIFLFLYGVYYYEGV